MRIEFPSRVSALRQLWQTVFGDDDAFLDAFFSLAWEPEHSLCAVEGDALAGMLYWLEGSCRGQKIAYVYAVATAPAFRGQGVCRRMLQEAQRCMTDQGFAGAVLVPASPQLRQMYEKLGWETWTRAAQLECRGTDMGLSLEPVSPEVYASLRRKMLPEGGVLLEERSLAFLASQEKLFAGPGILLAAHWDAGRLIAAELLGDPQLAPGITAALGADSGCFRLPGQGEPFAMGKKLTSGCPDITWFALAFD